MNTEHRSLMWITSILFLSGLFCQEWRVDYQESVCAVKGSAVVIPCLFYYPKTEKVREIMWGHERNIFDGPFVFDKTSKNSSRFQYIGNKRLNCSLKIKQVDVNDAGKYAFRFITKSKHGKWTGESGSILKIVDLKIVVTNMNGHTAMKEGDSVTVTCQKSCNGSGISSAFTWFKNGEFLREGPSLYWRDISLADSGNYTCSLKAHSGTTSGVLHMNVEYGPKNTSASVRPSTEVDVVILSCSSHADPPVENYTWFKAAAADDEKFTIVGNKSELHFREVSVSAGGRYLCRATNRHGSQNSTLLIFKVNAHFPYIFIIAAAAATPLVLIVAVVIIGIRRFNGRRAGKPEQEADHAEDQQVAPSVDDGAVYLNWPISENHTDGNWCGEIENVYTTIDFDTKRKTNTQQQMYSHSHDDRVIYSTLQFHGAPIEPFIR